LKQQGVDTDFVFDQIKDCCAKALLATEPFVQREQEMQMNMKKAKGKCF